MVVPDLDPAIIAASEVKEAIIYKYIFSKVAFYTSTNQF
jgi:hypothetical protein